jgi:hypothetical protein
MPAGIGPAEIADAAAVIGREAFLGVARHSLVGV